MRVIGLAGGENRHFLVQPVRAVLALQLGLQMQVHVDQMSDIGQRVGQLLFRQRPCPPIREAGRLVDLCAGDLLHDLLVGDAVAEAADHRRNLGVEHRMRNQAAQIEDDLDVLPRGMKDFRHRLVGHQLEERRKVETWSQRIDERGISGDAIWMRQSSGQNVVSRMNSVSTVTKVGLRQGSSRFRQFFGSRYEAHARVFISAAGLFVKRGFAFVTAITPGEPCEDR